MGGEIGLLIDHLNNHPRDIEEGRLEEPQLSSSRRGLARDDR